MFSISVPVSYYLLPHHVLFMAVSCVQPSAALVALRATEPIYCVILSHLTHYFSIGLSFHNSKRHSGTYPILACQIPVRLGLTAFWVCFYYITNNNNKYNLKPACNLARMKINLLKVGRVGTLCKSQNIAIK